MDNPHKPYVQLAINEVNAVILDPAGQLDAEQYDRYATFEEARDAALCCIEAMLDAGDYDDDRHRAELRTMLDLLESARTFDELSSRPEYRWFLDQLTPDVRAVA